jgi:hypothetical protein
MIRNRLSTGSALTSMTMKTRRFSIVEETDEDGSDMSSEG